MRPIRPASLALLLSGVLAGCSSVPRTDEGVPEPVSGVRQARIHAPYPQGTEVSALRALFASPQAPPREELDTCDFDYRVEKRLAGNREGLMVTFPKHVSSNPEKYHWCFYWKLLALKEGGVASDRLWGDLRFLTDLARVFEADFEDESYLRQLVSYYKDYTQRK